MTTPKMTQQPVSSSTVEPQQMTTPKMIQQPVPPSTVEPHRMTTPKVAVVCIMAVVMYYVFCRMRTAGYREQDSSPESGIRLQPVPTRSTERSTRSLAASTSPEGDPAKDGEKKTRSYTRGTPQTVIIMKQEGQKIGLSTVGGSDSPRGPEFFVKALDPHGLAAASGYIKKNDKIISINRKLLCGLTHKQAIDAFNTFISGRMLIEIQQQTQEDGRPRLKSSV
ncbi:multiple PDZ domain protein-like isoform X1 [Schistocerca americana]|uniref:multiple PDZ domain protein-like isoform X1 n=2 Tax=Schistocerca americana TaxID=7009 RepID=UPI001F4FCAFF|nr:multiple PDZ domain protein-like isoform X1 [Schistocerca americana]